MELKQIFTAWKKVFKGWKYVSLAIFIAFTFYSFNTIIGNWEALTSFYSSLGFFRTIKLFFTLLLGFHNTVTFPSFISLIIISVLFGLLFSLIIYKTIEIKTALKGGGIFASVGIFLGALAPGCAACGIGLLSVFGFSVAFLTFLPFDGLELSILSIAILSFSTIKISQKINEGITCKIN
ncbi:MAG: hypothetical protein WDZ77_02615 [Candidatus Pacearchaeota archaeon]